jgi:hypothetical protein
MSKNVNIRLGADITEFQSKMRNAQKLFNKSAASFKKIGRSMTISLTAPLTAFGAASIKAFDTQAKAIAQVEQGLKTTGGLVGRTSQQLQRMASDLQSKTMFGDEVILKDATAQLLTFTNITGDQFDRTQVAALDLATRLDGDLKSASIQLGKALNDPIANLSALSRSGIQFSKDQKEVIKTLAESNRLADAQTIILDELEKQYGGSAEAAAKAGAGPLKQLQNSFGDLMEEIGQMLIPVLQKLIGFIQNMIDKWKGLDRDTKAAIITFGGFVAVVGPSLLIISKMIGFLGTMSSGIALVSKAFTGLKFASIKAWASALAPVTAVVAGIAVVGSAILYIVDNYEAFKERFSDVSWWKNAVLQMLQWFIEYNPLSMLTKGFNSILRFFGRNELPNPFEKLADGLEELKSETKQYENEFGSFKDAIVNGANKAKKAFAKLGLDFGVGGDGEVKKENKEETAPVIDTSNFIEVEEIDWDEEDEELNIYLENLARLKERMQNIRNITHELGTALSENLASGFANAVTSGQNFAQSMIEIFKNIAKQIASMIIQALVLSVLFTYLGIGDAKGMTQSAGLFKNFTTALTGKAGGGNVVAGQPYMVGEKGPEMFMPGQSGTIIPNQNLGGSIIPDVRITGDDLLIVFEKAQRRKERR